MAAAEDCVSRGCLAFMALTFVPKRDDSTLEKKVLVRANAGVGILEKNWENMVIVVNKKKELMFQQSNRVMSR